MQNVDNEKENIWVVQLQLSIRIDDAKFPSLAPSILFRLNKTKLAAPIKPDYYSKLNTAVTNYASNNYLQNVNWPR